MTRLRGSKPGWTERLAENRHASHRDGLSGASFEGLLPTAMTVNTRGCEARHRAKIIFKANSIDCAPLRRASCTTHAAVAKSLLDSFFRKRFESPRGEKIFQ